jgi:NAD kinase
LKDVLVVYKKSLYDIYKQSRDENVQEYLKSNNLRIQRMIEGHDTHNKNMGVLQKVLEELGVSHDFAYRADLDKFSDINERQMIIAAGGDGTVLEVARHLTGSKILGYVTDTLYSTGFFSWTNSVNIMNVLANIDSEPITSQKRFKVVKNGNTLSTMLNDVCFDDKNPATRSLWEVQDLGFVGGSGILIASAVGSTAWIYQEGGEIMDITDERLQYKVRANRTLAPGYNHKIKVTSHTREGVISIDGAHNRFTCSLGDILEVVPNDNPIKIIGDMNILRKKWQYLRMKV